MCVSATKGVTVFFMDYSIVEIRERLVGMYTLILGVAISYIVCCSAFFECYKNDVINFT